MADLVKEGEESDGVQEKEGKQQSNLLELCRCLLCEEQFDLKSDEQHQPFLKHILERHKIVIGDVNLVADLHSYVEYWRERFKTGPLTEFCPVIRTNSEKPASSGLQEDFYLLCDALEEDKELRSRLQQQRLKDVLAQHAEEREDTTFFRGCLFCRKNFEGNRSVLFQHLSESHNLFLGQPDNIVFCMEFLDKIEEKLDQFVCLYCEKTFKDRNIMKEHMRKKQHKRLNPKNSSWDKYYLINYLEFGKNWEQIQREPDDPDPRVWSSSGETEEEEEERWSDWEEGAAGAVARLLCLFCTALCPEVGALESHMTQEHGFDFRSLINSQEMNFYEKVKLVNFVRRQVEECRCMYCEEKYSAREELLSHMNKAKHYRLPCSSLWNQPQYYFPTYEDDQLLCTLQDDVLDSENYAVIAEDEAEPQRWSEAAE